MNAVDFIIKDHRTIESMFARYETAANPAEKSDIVEEFTRELAQHAALEEQFLYPLMRFTDEKGPEKAEHSIDEHQEIKELLAAVEKRDTADESWYEKVNEAIKSVRHHVEEEERDVLPRIRESFSEDRLNQLGALMDKAKGLMPTHPHPNVPGYMVTQLLAGPWASIADHARDFFEDLQKKGAERQAG